MMKTKTVFGSGGTAAITYQHPMVLRNVLGANVEAVTGYAGTRDINLAMNRGEVNGSCGLFESSISSQWGNEVKTGQLKPQALAVTANGVSLTVNIADVTKVQKPKADVKVGDIFVCSCGYEQTNIDFYKIVDVTKSSRSEEHTSELQSH